LAHLYRSGEGQFVEHRPVSLRIAEATNALGAGGYGPVHTSDHRVWHSPRNCRWPSLCSMFRRAIRGKSLPKYLSTDHDPLYRFHQWQANLRVLEVMEIKTVPYVPLSHPFVERLVGTLRRECLDRTLFWTAADLEAKLPESQSYFNEYRTHAGLEGQLPDSGGAPSPISFASYGWQKHCRGLYQTPPRDFMNSPCTAAFAHQTANILSSPRAA